MSGLKEESISSFVVETIESLGTYNFMYGYKKDWSIFFEEQLRDILLKEVTEKELENQKNMLVVKAKVTGVDITLLREGHARASFLLTNRFVEKGKTYVQKQLCEVNVIYVEKQMKISDILVRAC